jgi:hypothetical protein
MSLLSAPPQKRKAALQPTFLLALSVSPGTNLSSRSLLTPQTNHQKTAAYHGQDLCLHKTHLSAGLQRVFRHKLRWPQLADTATGNCIMYTVDYQQPTPHPAPERQQLQRTFGLAFNVSPGTNLSSRSLLTPPASCSLTMSLLSVIVGSAAGQRRPLNPRWPNSEFCACTVAVQQHKVSASVDQAAGQRRPLNPS